ncbi:hypothetical protein [Frigidibacter oleivorans]|uniref:hypothetical protein n=1 Tax=Frigidibacter oleivorans TaxID=2487129 RepID=UPI00197AEE5C|nr:hypothetical protein [Frigidibacter oleivorans]
MPTRPTIARIWCGRTRRTDADDYAAYNRREGVPPLEETALGVQLFREDREDETWFTTVSYWADMEAMTSFTGGDPTEVHHLARDPELLIDLPARIEIHRILDDRQGLRDGGPRLARIWRARTRRARADDYEPYLRAGGIPPLQDTAMGFQLLREDREQESWFTFISYWNEMAEMRAFTKGDPTKVHLLPRGDELLIEKPDRVEICRILVDREGLR